MVIDDKPNPYIDRDVIGHPATDTLLHGVFGLPKGIRNIFKGRGIGKILDGKYGFKNRMQPLFLSVLGWNIPLKKPFKGLSLHPYEIRDVYNFTFTAKLFSNSLVRQKTSGHDISRCEFFQP